MGLRITALVSAFTLSAGLSIPCIAQDSLTWTSQTSGTRRDLWSIFFVDTLHGWAVGNYGAAVRTVNGGSSWTACAFGTSDTLQSIVFADPARGWVAGNSGIIYVSSDSGKSWNPQLTRSRTWYADAWLFDDQTVLFVGATDTTPTSAYDYHGFVVRTTDGGQNWSGVIVPNPSSLGSVCFVGGSRGWASGLDQITTTSNGGQSWSAAQDPMPAASYRAYVNVIWFTDSTRGFGAGRYGGIIGTIGGGGWHCIDTSSGSWIEDICFADAEHGVAVGERGMIAASVDSGKTWRRRYPRHPSTLNAPWFRAVFFLDAQHGWTAGDSGIIMRGRFVQPTTATSPPAYRNRFLSTQPTRDRRGIYAHGPNPAAGTGIVAYELNGKLISHRKSPGRPFSAVGQERLVIVKMQGSPQMVVTQIRR